jgi:hypothetical protein
MANVYCVAPGYSFVSNGKVYKPYDIITAAAFPTPAAFENKIAKGQIILAPEAPPETNPDSPSSGGDSMTGSGIQVLYVENQPLPILPGGRVDLPIANPKGDRINPFYVGPFSNPAEANSKTVVNDYVDLLQGPPIAKPYFAFNTNNNKIMIPQLGAEIVTDSLQNVFNRTVAAITGTPISTIEFNHQLTDFMNNRFAIDNSIAIYDYGKAMDTSSKICDIQFYANSFDDLFGDYPSAGSYVRVHFPSGENYAFWTGGFQTGLTINKTYNGITVTASYVDGFKINFSSTVSIVNNVGFEDMESQVRDYGSYIYDVGAGIWQWTNTEFNIGDPKYPRLIMSEKAKTGMTAGLRIDKLVQASFAKVLMTSQPNIGQLLNNIVSEHNQAGSVPDNASRITLWSSNPDGSLADDYIKYWNPLLTHAVQCDYFDGTNLTVIPIIDEDDEWVYPLASFDPAEALNLPHNFYFHGTEETVPWDDTRIQNYIAVTLQQLVDDAIAHGSNFS